MSGDGRERDGWAQAGSDEGEPGSETAWEPPEPYRPIGRRAKIVSVLLLVGILADVAALTSGGMERALLEDVSSGGIITQAEADRSDLRQLAVALAQGAVFVLTAVAFLFWFSRAYRNLTALGASGLRFGRGWAVGAWFVPILNTWRPKQIANDVWRASDPELPARQRLEWEGGPVPRLFLAWWLAYLAMTYLYSFSGRRSLRAETVDELLGVNALYIVADTVAVLAAALAFFVVRRTTARQTARAGRLGLVPEEDPTRLWRRRSAWAAVLAVLAGLALQAAVAVLVWGGVPGSSSPGDAAPAPAGAPPGTLLADDFSQAGAWLVQDDASVRFDYADGSYRALLKEQGFWSSGHVLPREVDRMSVEADATLRSGDVVTDFFGVTCLTSERGSYLFGVAPDGYHTIGVDPGGDQNLELNRLVEGWADERFGADGEALRIHATCAREGEAMRLSLSVNGATVARANHRGDLGELAGVEVFVYAAAGGTDVRFDNLVVREAGSR